MFFTRNIKKAKVAVSGSWRPLSTRGRYEASAGRRGRHRLVQPGGTGSAGPEPLQHDRGSARGSVEPGPWERWDLPLGLVFLSGVVSFKNCRKVFKISKYHPSFP